MVSLDGLLVTIPEAPMEAQQIKDEWIHLEENDPPPDLSRETAAFERERARLVRDHLGKIAVIHGDDIVGVYDNVNDAVLDSCTRLGNVRLLYFEITERDEPVYIANVDVNHPSVRRLD
jgi:hypothetical protein